VICIVGECDEVFVLNFLIGGDVQFGEVVVE